MIYNLSTKIICDKKLAFLLILMIILKSRMLLIILNLFTFIHYLGKSILWPPQIVSGNTKKKTYYLYT